MSSGGTGGGGIIIRSAKQNGQQVLVTVSEGQEICDCLTANGYADLAAKIQPIVDNAS